MTTGFHFLQLLPAAEWRAAETSLLSLSEDHQGHTLVTRCTDTQKGQPLAGPPSLAGARDLQHSRLTDSWRLPLVAMRKVTFKGQHLKARSKLGFNKNAN